MRHSYASGTERPPSELDILDVGPVMRFRTIEELAALGLLEPKPPDPGRVGRRVERSRSDLALAADVLAGLDPDRAMAVTCGRRDDGRSGAAGRPCDRRGGGPRCNLSHH